MHEFIDDGQVRSCDVVIRILLRDGSESSHINITSQTALYVFHAKRNPQILKQPNIIQLSTCRTTKAKACLTHLILRFPRRSKNRYLHVPRPLVI